MGNIIGWVTENWKTIVEVYLAIIGLASVIVKLTPTLKDDNILLGIIKFVGKYIALNRNGMVDESTRAAELKK